MLNRWSFSSSVAIFLLRSVNMTICFFFAFMIYAILLYVAIIIAGTIFFSTQTISLYAIVTDFLKSFLLEILVLSMYQYPKHPFTSNTMQHIHDGKNRHIKTTNNFSEVSGLPILAQYNPMRKIAWQTRHTPSQTIESNRLSNCFSFRFFIIYITPVNYQYYFALSQHQN